MMWCQRLIRSFCIGVALAVIAGCAAPLAQLQQARALRRGEVQVGAAASVSLMEASLAEAVLHSDLPSKPSSSGLASVDPVSLSRIAAALHLYPPSVNHDVSVRVGLGWGLDVGLRTAGSSQQLEVKRQFLDAQHGGVDLSVSLSAGFVLDPSERVFGQVAGLPQAVAVDGSRRWRSGLTLHLGRDLAPWFSLWGGVGVNIDDAMAITVVTPPGSLESPSTRLTWAGRWLTYAGHLGFKVGHGRVFLLVECALGYARGDMIAAGELLSLSGLQFAPSFGLQVNL